MGTILKVKGRDWSCQGEGCVGLGTPYFEIDGLQEPIPKDYIYPNITLGK